MIAGTGVAGMSSTVVHTRVVRTAHMKGWAAGPVGWHNKVLRTVIVEKGQDVAEQNSPYSAKFKFPTKYTFFPTKYTELATVLQL